MQLTFTSKNRVHTAPVANGTKIVIANAGSGWGWHITLRNAKGGIICRLGSDFRTLTEAKAVATDLAGHEKFRALLIARA